MHIFRAYGQNNDTLKQKRLLKYLIFFNYFKLSQTMLQILIFTCLQLAQLSLHMTWPPQSQNKGSAQPLSSWSFWPSPPRWRSWSWQPAIKSKCMPFHTTATGEPAEELPRYCRISHHTQVLQANLSNGAIQIASPELLTSHLKGSQRSHRFSLSGYHQDSTAKTALKLEFSQLGSSTRMAS